MLLDEGATAIAGGTDLLGLMKGRVATPERVVDLTGITGLGGWSKPAGGGLRIGALTPLVELETSAELTRDLPILRLALADAATEQLRNMGTVGGNLLQHNRCWYYRDDAFHCWLKGGSRCFAIAGDNRYHSIIGASTCVMTAPSDLAPALIASDAEIQLHGASGSRVIKLNDLYQAPGGNERNEHTLRRGEILTEVRIPEAAIGRKSAFIKAMDRKAWSFALVSVAVTARLDGGIARDVRIVLGGIAPRPWRADEAAAGLEGKPLNEVNAARAADMVVSGAAPLKDNAYKVTLARENVRRALISLLS